MEIFTFISHLLYLMCFIAYFLVPVFIPNKNLKNIHSFLYSFKNYLLSIMGNKKSTIKILCIHLSNLNMLYRKLFCYSSHCDFKKHSWRTWASVFPSVRWHKYNLSFVTVVKRLLCGRSSCNGASGNLIKIFIEWLFLSETDGKNMIPKL